MYALNTAYFYPEEMLFRLSAYKKACILIYLKSGILHCRNFLQKSLE